MSERGLGRVGGSRMIPPQFSRTVATRHGVDSGSAGGRGDLGLGDCAVFFDFDNTIAPFDVLEAIIRRFAVNRDWMRLQKAWEAGRIGSRDCLTGQLRLVRVTKAALSRYLSTVKLDPSFQKLIVLLRRHGTQPIIVSDNFLFVVSCMLRSNRARGMRVYANRVRFTHDRLIPSFPYYDNRCERGCANCKRQHLARNSRNKGLTIYIGDGPSDICPAEQADVVFAKGRLLHYLRTAGRPCLPFRRLADVYDYFLERADR